MASLHPSHHPVGPINHAQPVTFSPYEVLAMEAQPVQGNDLTQPRHLYVDPANGQVLIEIGGDGADLYQLCTRHQWASNSVPERDLLPRCPLCVAELESQRGRERYRLLHDRLQRGR